MLRVTVIGDVQQVARQTLQELGFGGNEQLYRLSLAVFRRRLVPALEATFAARINRTLSAKGLHALIDVRAFKFRRVNGELNQLSSEAVGEGAERIKLDRIEQAWNLYLKDAFAEFLQQNLEWLLEITSGQRRSEPDWDWLA
jgi:hypothetical protein